MAVWCTGIASCVIIVIVGSVILQIRHPTFTQTELFLAFWPWYLVSAAILIGWLVLMTKITGGK